MPKHAITDDEILLCFDVMDELRPHLKREDFLMMVRSMEKEGNKLAFAENEGALVAVAGYRIYTNLFVGKHLYVDDLVTASNLRSKGYGAKMVNWLRTKAIEEGCSYFHLDSGVHRYQAYKFYFNQDFTIASYHFSEQLNIS